LKNNYGFTEIGCDNLYFNNRVHALRLLQNNGIKILLKSNLQGKSNPYNEDEIFEVAFSVTDLEAFMQY